MPRLVLGPLLRYVSESEATFWVETDVPCEVEILAHRARTFTVEGHHYAIVAVRGLPAGARYEYTVRLDGQLVWPEPDSPFPVSVLRTLDPAHRLRICFGSCRVVAPHAAPHTLDRLRDRQGRGLDALVGYTRRLLDAPREEYPQALLLLGDQVYADDVPAGTRDFIRSRRSTREPPHEGVADFQEYAFLYQESWSEPVVRWLLSTVSTSMIFDDHDVNDDWNISESWVAEMRRLPWWNRRVVAAFESYWVYQHLGNLTPDELDANPILRAVREAEDGGAILRDFAFAADRETAGCRWAYRRDFGSTRLIVLDSRAARVLEGGRRDMIDDVEWDWVEEHATGDVDHLVLVSSLPFLLVPGMHALQAWNEALCAGRWGRTLARMSEGLRRAIDLEHWASFGASFERLAALLCLVGSGKRGRAPHSITILSGDVHHGYLARVSFRRSRAVTSAVYQVVCSPFRNSLGAGERRAQRLGASRAGEWLLRGLARLARVTPPIIRWRSLEGLTFDNQIGTLEITGREARVRLERAVDRGLAEAPALETVWERRLAPVPLAEEMAVDTADRPGTPDPRLGEAQTAEGTRPQAGAASARSGGDPGRSRSPSASASSGLANR